MIRRIPARQLMPGMYVVDLHKSWLEHGLWRNRFLVGDEGVVQRLIDDGVTEVSIDTDRGLDLPVQGSRSGRCPWPAGRSPFTRGHNIPRPSVSLGEERRRVGRLLRAATAAVQARMEAVRAGRVADPGGLEPLIGQMIDSVSRHPDALVPSTRLKGSHTYGAEHAVATSALIIALAHRCRRGLAEVERLALGALVKDIGQVALDARLMAKCGRLSSRERSVVQSHVEESLVALDAARRLPATALAVVLEHHERFDGSGYPYRRAGEAISPAGRMAAIVDVYDALASDRPYRRALSPAAALRQVYRGCGRLFDPGLVASFVHAVGVYPVGSLVRLESGHLAVVYANHFDKLLHPVVRVIFHAGRRQYITPVEVDLARAWGNPYGQILGTEEFADWGISPLRWQPA